MGTKCQIRTTSIADAQTDLVEFDAWAARLTERTNLNTRDVATAAIYLRRLDLTSATPDALHIAIAGRLGATLVTIDHGMAAAARVLGMAVATP
jgi:uncharacterized protein